MVGWTKFQLGFPPYLCMFSSSHSAVRSWHILDDGRGHVAFAVLALPKRNVFLTNWALRPRTMHHVSVRLLPGIRRCSRVSKTSGQNRREERQTILGMLELGTYGLGVDWLGYCERAGERGRTVHVLSVVHTHMHCAM